MQRSLLILLLVIGLAATAQAEFNYNYVGISYGNVEFDDLNVDGDGFGFTASLGISENFHLFGGAEFADLDFNVDITRWGAGVGFNTPVSEAMDVIARLSYESVDIDVPVLGSADDDGYGVGIGLRVEASSLVEIEAAVSYVDFSDSGNDTVFDVGALFHVTDNFSVGLNGTFDDDVNIYRIAGRFYF